MAEILTKEKQYLKLNEQLDKMAIASSKYELNTNNNAVSAVGKNNKSEGRYLTYQKTKGQSTLLKRIGAGGDGMTDTIDNKNVSHSFKEQRKNVNKAAGGGGETYRTSRHIQSSPHHNPYHCKTAKQTDTSRSHTCNRTTNRSVMPPNNSTFSIKYHNSKFVESPSLEFLVKEESSSLRCQGDSNYMGSVNSLATNDAISCSQSSQVSYNAPVVTKKTLSSEGLIKFLKSKIIILEEDHERISQEMIKQTELLDKALEHSKTIEQQRDQAIAKNNTFKEQVIKNEKQLEEVSKHLKERSKELNALQREFETTKRELKILTQGNNNLEKRLYRANEELESARNTISSMKAYERELKESQRLETEAKEKQIKSLKKQRADLLNAYKKQLFLIDNLKRQNICLEQAKMMSFAEKEFTRVLDWDMKS